MCVGIIFNGFPMNYCKDIFWCSLQISSNALTNLKKRNYPIMGLGLYGWKSSVQKSSKTSNILPRTPSTPHKLQNTQTISKWLLTAREGGEGCGVIVRYFYRKLPKLCQSYQLYSNNRKDPKIYLEKNSGL